MDKSEMAMYPIDGSARDAVLTSLLRRHPGALISAIDADGLFVDLPPSIELLGQEVVQARSALELVDAGHRSAILEAWDRAKLVGTAVAPVVLVNGVVASYHFIDVRHRHGVLVGVIVADAQIELVSALVGRAPIVPKTGCIEKDEVAVIRAADDRICQILGYEPADLIGTRSLEFVHPEDQDRAVDAWMDMLTVPGGTTRLRARHRRGDGSWLWMEITNSNRLAEPEGRVVTEMIDISDEMAALEALRQREQLLGRLTEALPSGVLHVDGQRNVVYANARLHSVVGVGPSATVGEQLATIIPEDVPAFHAVLDGVLVDGRDADLEVRLRVPGEPRLRLCAIATRALTDVDGAPAGAVLCIDDVTEASELRGQLEHRATIDELTGCLNRAAVLDALGRTLRRHTPTSRGTALVFIDLDGFKEVNDTFGHNAGDALLVSAGARLRGAMRNVDLIGRFGGDEFIVVVPEVDGIEEAMLIGARLGEALAEPLEAASGLPMRIRSSIGVAWAHGEAIDADALVAAADRAMYESKRGGICAPVYASV